MRSATTSTTPLGGSRRPLTTRAGLERPIDGREPPGPAVHDARVAALCLAYGVRELWTADRAFGRFPALRVRDPLAP